VAHCVKEIFPLLSSRKWIAPLLSQVQSSLDTSFKINYHA
jgi:hypothetical protein